VSGQTTSAQSHQDISWLALGNTTQNSSSVINASAVSLNGLGIVTVGYSNGSIQISATQSVETLGLYALGNTTQNSSTTLDARSLSLNGLGIVTVGYSNGSIQVSATVAAQTNQSVGLYAVGNTTNNSSTTLDARTISVRGDGDVTVGYAAGSLRVSVNVTAAQTVQTANITMAGTNTYGNTASTIT